MKLPVRVRHFWLSMVVVGFLVQIVSAQRLSVEVFELEYRSGEELAVVLQPVIENEGTIAFMDHRLIVRATPEKINEIRALIARLDTPPANLLITVQEGAVADAGRQGASVEGRVGTNPRVELKPPVSVPGARASIEGGATSMEASGGYFLLHDSDSRSQKIRTMDGRPAVIQMGMLIPFTSKQVTQSFLGNTVNESVQWQQVVTGVRVLPRLQGDRVTVEVYPQSSDLNPQGIGFREAMTTVSGRLGEWIEIGGVVQERLLQSSGLAGVEQSQLGSVRSIHMKVELMP